MTYYLLLIIFAIFISIFFKEFESKKSRKTFLIITGICMFLFFALRSRYIGSTDTQNYYNMLQRAIGKETWDEFYNPGGVEKGFQIFVFILSRLFDEPQMIIVVSSALIVFSAFYFIYRNAEDPAMAVMLFITLGLLDFEFQGMRQSMAMSICILSYEFVKSRKLIPFVLTVLLASTFHRTAVVFLIVYAISYLAYNWKGIITILATSVAVFILSDRIVNIANNMFESEYTSTVSKGGFVATAIYVLIIAFAIISNTKMKDSKTEALSFYMTVLGGVTYAMRYFGALASERISYYFIFAQLLILPSTIACFNKRDQRFIKIVVYLLAIALFIYRTNGSSLDPYKFFWTT